MCHPAVACAAGRLQALRLLKCGADMERSAADMGQPSDPLLPPSAVRF